MKSGVGNILLLSFEAATNDECMVATTLALGTSTSFNTTLATACTTIPYPTCSLGDAGSNTDDAWFTFTPANGGFVHFLTCNGSFNTMMAIYMGSCGGSLTQQACNNDAGGSCTVSAINLVVATGTTHFVRIGGFAGQFYFFGQSGVSNILLSFL